MLALITGCIVCRVFGHFDMPLFLELCKSFQTLHLFKGQKLFSIGESVMSIACEGGKRIRKR